MSPSTITSALSLLLAAASVTARPAKRDDFTPTVASIVEVGNMADPSIDRDSCGSGSVRFGDRIFWTCRDSNPYDANGHAIFPIWSSSASWSNMDASGNPSTAMYGGDGGQNPYFPYAGDECGAPAGKCEDGTRYALWPDSGPLVTSIDGNIYTAYTFMRKTHIRGLKAVDKDPATSLYKMTVDVSNPDRNALPSVQMVNENIWPKDGIPYGAYGGTVKDGIAYLWGQTSGYKVGLAKVPVAGIEDRLQYQYLVNGNWTAQMPGKDDGNFNIVNVSAGGQGTYYFSNHWNKWVWIGQAYLSTSAEFMITTADNVEGPWAKPVFFYKGHNGNYILGAYTLQAHPEMNLDDDANQIYISYTKNDADGDLQHYTTPLVKITWN